MSAIDVLIITALKEDAFDDEQMKVVRRELGGLKDYVIELERELKKTNKSLDQLDQSLWEIRDQRLGEALALLRGGR